MERIIRVVILLIFVLTAIWVGIHLYGLSKELKDYSFALEFQDLGTKEETGKDQYRYSDPIKLNRKEYREGDVLRYQLTFCKNVPEGAELVGVLQDGTNYLYPTISSDVEEGCYDFEEATYIIPRVGDGGIPAGTYRLIKRVIYSPQGSDRDITFTVQTEEFEIVE